MSDEKKEEQQSAVPDLHKVLNQFDGAPSPDEVEAWKQQYGEVYCSGFSDTELFIWRPLSRREHTTIQKKLRTTPQNDQGLPDLDFEEEVVKSVMLWCSDEKSLLQKGGSYSTLSEQVMMHSNFMNQALAAALVVKL